METVVPKLKSCPSTHPFAFRNGLKCCLTDKNFEGNPISITDENCENTGGIDCAENTVDLCANYNGRFLLSILLFEVI